MNPLDQPHQVHTKNTLSTPSKILFLNIFGVVWLPFLFCLVLTKKAPLHRPMQLAARKQTTYPGQFIVVEAQVSLLKLYRNNNCKLTSQWSMIFCQAFTPVLQPNCPLYSKVSAGLCHIAVCLVQSTDLNHSIKCIPKIPYQPPQKYLFWTFLVQLGSLSCFVLGYHYHYTIVNMMFNSQNSHQMFVMNFNTCYVLNKSIP